MKRSKQLLLTALCMSSVTACAFGITACNTDKPTEQEHNYSTTWSYDDDSHYHACTDEDCTSIADDTPHDMGEWATVTPATEDTKGQEKRECSVCDFVEYRDTEKLTPAPPAPPAATHEHDWGAWTVTDENKPTATEEGKATRTCTGEGDCDGETADKEYVLPVLDSDEYTITDDTATEGVAGTGTYTYSKNGVTVSFTAETPAKPVPVPDPTPEHSHSWSAWTVTDENKPTATAEGKATRTCSGEGDCDGEAADKQYTLPMLGSEDYVITDDTATEGVAGTGTYTYSKNGVIVSFTAETPAKPVSVPVPTPEHSHSWSAWTVTDENKPTETAEGKATRTCSGEGDCDGETSDKEYTLPALTSADYSKTDDTATCSEGGSITYTYNKDGVSVSFEVATPVDPEAHSFVVNVTEYSSIEKTDSKVYKVEVECEQCNATLGTSHDFVKKVTTEVEELAQYGNLVILPEDACTVHYTVVRAGVHVLKIYDLLNIGFDVASVKLGTAALDESAVRYNSDGSISVTVSAEESDIYSQISVTLSGESAHSAITALVALDIPSIPLKLLTVGEENAVTISEAYLTVDSSTDFYNFIAPEAGWYTFRLPAGLNVSKYDNSNNSSVYWIDGGGEGDYGSVELAENEQLTLVFIGNEAKTYNVVIETGKPEQDTVLKYNQPLTARIGDISTQLEFTVGDDVPQDEYYLELTPSTNYYRNTFTIMVNGVEYKYGAGLGTSTDYDFKRKVNLKRGDTVSVSVNATTNGSITVTVKPLVNPEKLGVGEEGIYRHTFADQEMTIEVFLDDTVQSGYYTLNFALEGKKILSETISGETKYFYLDENDDQVKIITSISDLNGKRLNFTLMEDGSLDFPIALDYANRSTDTLRIVLQAGESGAYVSGFTAIYKLTLADKGVDDPELPTSPVLGVGDINSVTVDTSDKTALKIAPYISNGYYTLTVTVLEGEVNADTEFVFTGVSDNDIVLSGVFENTVSALVKLQFSEVKGSEYYVTCSSDGVKYKVTLVRASKPKNVVLGVGEENAATLTVNAQHGFSEYLFDISPELTDGYYEVTITAVNGTLSETDTVALSGFKAKDVVFTGFTDNSATLGVAVSFSDLNPVLISSLCGVTFEISFVPAEAPEEEKIYSYTVTGGIADGTKIIENNDYVTVTANKITSSATVTQDGRDYTYAYYRVGADILNIELEEGKHYKVTIKCALYGTKTPTFTLKDSSETEKGSVTATSTNKVIDLVVDNLEGGTYKLTSSNSGGIISIEIEILD